MSIFNTNAANIQFLILHPLVNTISRSGDMAILLQDVIDIFPEWMR
jgi:hypothetical protein